MTCQWHSQSQTTRGFAFARHPVSAATVQRYCRSENRETGRHAGSGCFDCHVNGHTDGAFHEVGDIRPQENRRRIETTSLRGVNIQRLFGYKEHSRQSRTSPSSSTRRLLRWRRCDCHQERREHSGARLAGSLHGGISDILDFHPHQNSIFTES